MYDGNTEYNEKMTTKGSLIIMKKAIMTNAKYAITAVLSIIMLIALTNLAIGRYTDGGTACHVDYKNSFSVN